MKNFLLIAILLFSANLSALESACPPKTATQQACAHISAAYWKLSEFAFATECLMIAIQRELDFHWLYAGILGASNAMMLSMCAGDTNGACEEQGR